MLSLILSLIMYSVQVETAEISFGNGGGFSGISHNYTLDRHGNLYEVIFTEDRTLLKKIDKEKTEALFALVEEGKLRDITHHKPGNTYKYISLKDGIGSHKLVWSGISENNTLNLIYKHLNALRKSKE